MIRFPPGGEDHPHDVEWNACVHFFNDLAPESTAERERKPVLAKNCWLYVFDQYGMQVAEVFADDKGIYHGVDLAKHFGKDIRPYALSGDDVASELSLYAGQKSLKRPAPDTEPGNNLQKYFYWILPSPFQLPWSRFPHITDTGKKNSFQNWAESQRGLRASFPELDKTTGDPLKVLAIECPWLQSKALNQCFKKAQERWITRFLKNEERTRMRTLCSYIRTVETVVGKARFEKNADDLIFKQHFLDEEKTLKEDLTEPPELAAARTALVRYLKGQRFVAMKEDALASPDTRAIGIYSEIKSDAKDGLEGIGGDPEYRESASKEDDFVLKLEIATVEEKVKKFLGDYPLVQPVVAAADHWKEARKVAKSYWYLVKAYAAEIAWRNPDKLTSDMKWVGRSLFGVFIEWELPKGSPPKTMPNGGVKYARLIVKEGAEGRLKKKFINNPAWNSAFVALDTLNLAMACKDRAEGKGDMKPIASAMGSFLNTSASALEASLGRQRVERLFMTEKTMAEDIAKMAGKKSNTAGGGNFGSLLRKFNTPKTFGLAGKAFGAIGSTYEILNSIEKANKAGAAFDSEAATAHWISVGANALTTLGYVAGFTGTLVAIISGATVGLPVVLGAIGAALIFGGSATDMGLKFALPSLEHDPLENWMRVSPWGQEVKHRLPTFDAQVEAFYKALAGLRVTYRHSIASFDVTVESRRAQLPAQVFLEIEWTSDAGTFKNPMAMMTEANREGPTTFRHNEFSTTPRQVIARVRLNLDDAFYPTAGPAEFKFPE